MVDATTNRIEIVAKTYTVQQEKNDRTLHGAEKNNDDDYTPRRCLKNDILVETNRAIHSRTQEPDFRKTIGRS